MKTPIVDSSKIPVLSALEDLGAITKKSGLIDIKPFRDWKGTTWKDNIFTLRLCNAGELLDIESSCGNLPENARSQVIKIELLIKSVFAISNGHPMVTEEDVKKYNEDNNTTYTITELLRIWARNLEQIVLDRLNAIYGGLQLKQVRKIQNIYLCENCAEVFQEITPEFKILKYSVGEVICPGCILKIDESDYDFEEVKVVKKSVPIVPEKKTVIDETDNQEGSFTFKGRICNCGEEFNSLEELVTHRENCAKAWES